MADVTAAEHEPARVVELFGTAACPYTGELRDHLHWMRTPFTEYDVDADESALARMLSLTRGCRTVPVLVRDGVVTDIGWRGRGCTVGTGAGM